MIWNIVQSFLPCRSPASSEVCKMVGVREARRNWLVPDYEGSATYSTSGRPATCEWQSEARAAFTRNKVSGSSGRHDASSRCPRNIGDSTFILKGSDRVAEWSSTSQTAHKHGLDGYMFLGVPNRFKDRVISPGEPLDTLTINRWATTKTVCTRLGLSTPFQIILAMSF